MTGLRQSSRAHETLSALGEQWSELPPSDAYELWRLCLSQTKETLLKLLAHCAAVTMNGVQTKQDRPDSPRLAHAKALGAALNLDLSAWFTPIADSAGSAGKA